MDKYIPARIPQPPRRLTKGAKAEWRRIIPMILAGFGWSPYDRTWLEVYVCELDRYKRAAARYEATGIKVYLKVAKKARRSAQDVLSFYGLTLDDDTELVQEQIKAEFVVICPHCGKAIQSEMPKGNNYYAQS